MNQGRVLNDKKTIEESSIEPGATIEMSLRIMGGMEEEELMETSETQEDIKKRKLKELSESKPSRRSEDVEIISATKRSDEKMENFSERTEEQMESYAKRTDEKWKHFCIQSRTQSVPKYGVTGTTESTKELQTWRKVLHDRRGSYN